MQTMQEGYRGLQLLLSLNWDRALYIAMITFALLAATWVTTIIGHGPFLLH